MTAASLCLEGTAKKIFGQKADYYQSMHAINVISEAMWRLFWEAFENWIAENGIIGTDWTVDVEQMLQIIVDQSKPPQEQLKLIDANQAQLGALQEQVTVFRETLQDRPTAVFWMNFFDMSDILHKFTLHEREGNWIGYLSEAAKMLPYLTAAGHYKYGQQSLPLYLHEMKQLPEIAPEVHQACMQGAFVGRRAEGHHNGVSPDMLLEQTYNADAKEASGLGGITTNSAACAKWVYTKPVTAAVSSQLKNMLYLNPDAENPHHEGGKVRIERDAQQVLNVLAAIEISPFASNSNLINIYSGQHADPIVQKNLLNVKEIGTEALSKSIQVIQKTTKTVKLQTFATQNKKAAKSGTKASGNMKSNECLALLRMIQIAVSGVQVDIVNYIGNHECSNFPPSMFTEDGHMRTGNKANLIKAIEDETGLGLVSQLPGSEHKTAVMVDAMFAIRHWSFHKGETFGQIAQRFKHLLLSDIPSDTESIHFCCDRYRTESLKTAERQKRSQKSAPAKVYDIQEQIHAPEPLEFFSVSANKAGLLKFLCEMWSEEAENPSLGDIQLYLGGGFQEENKTIRISE